MESLRQQSLNSFKTIVVDNGSTDSSEHFVKSNFPEIELICLSDNIGFSKAVNIGIRKALDDRDVTHILLLNNDIQCDKLFLDELLSGFVNDNVGSVAPKMLNYYNRTIIDDTGICISKSGMPYPRGQGETDEGQYDLPQYIFGACAGAAMYKREVFERVGLFDEDYFAYYEDVDLSFRLQLLGYKCRYNPKAVCYHKRGGTMSSNRTFHTYLIERNLITLRIKNYPLKVLLFYSLYYQFVRIWRFLGYLFVHSPYHFLAAVKGYIAGLWLIPKSLKKRRIIYSSKEIDPKKLRDLMK